MWANRARLKAPGTKRPASRPGWGGRLTCIMRALLASSMLISTLSSEMSKRTLRELKPSGVVFLGDNAATWPDTLGLGEATTGEGEVVMGGEGAGGGAVTAFSIAASGDGGVGGALWDLAGSVGGVSSGRPILLNWLAKGRPLLLTMAVAIVVR